LQLSIWREEIMLRRFALIVAILAWTPSALAQVPYFCRSAEGTRQIGLRNINSNCAGPRASPDRCYDAASLFIQVNRDLLQCPTVDRAGLRSDLARAQKIMQDMRSVSAGVAERSERRRIEYNRPRGHAPSYTGPSGFVGPAPSPGRTCAPVQGQWYCY
jgi:hypothetical protein